VQTRRLAGVPVLATYPATTYLDFHTEGTGSNTCPDKPYRMDNGQSDRQRSPVAPPRHNRSRAPGRSACRGQFHHRSGTFLYYDDLTAPRRFYSETLGLAPYFEREGVSLFHPTPGATIGLVKVPRAGGTPTVKRSVVMVSIVTDDVGGW